MHIFEKNVQNIWGEKGREWLSQLPSIIEFLSNYWSLSEIKPIANMSYNYVALAQRDKYPVVLKISFDKNLIADEYKALKHFDGNGSVKVLDINTAYNALLLEQAMPGYLLKEHHSANIDATIAIYASVVKKLANHALSGRDYTHVGEWCLAIDKIKDSRFDKHCVNKAKALKIALLDAPEREYLCHGDLHLENIIQHEHDWLAIDPKGIVGEMAFEAAAFDLISKAEMQEATSIADKIMYRIAKLARALNIKFDRLLAWFFLRVMIAAQWFVEDGGDPSTMLVLAAHLYPLVEKHTHPDRF